MNWRKRRHCPHIAPQGIYGDEAARTGYRLFCMDCGRLLDGPVLLAELRRNEPMRLADNRRGA